MEKIHMAISARFSHHRYKLFNSYVFSWESDYFSITNDGYMYEVEVKLSRADFKKDFTKYEKHKILTSAKNGDKNFAEKTPNRFYYCCPEGLIKKEELPEYAGLIYLDGDVNFSARQIKTAPLIHKNDLSDKYLRTLIDKFYFQFMKMRSEYLYAKRYGKKVEDVQRENHRLQQLIDIKADAGYIAKIEELKKLIEQRDRKIDKNLFIESQLSQKERLLERRDRQIEELNNKLYDLQSQILTLKNESLRTPLNEKE